MLARIHIDVGGVAAIASPGAVPALAGSKRE